MCRPLRSTESRRRSIFRRWSYGNWCRAAARMPATSPSSIRATGEQQDGVAAFPAGLPRNRSSMLGGCFFMPIGFRVQPGLPIDARIPARAETG